jgi:hypothetical protein
MALQTASGSVTCLLLVNLCIGCLNGITVLRIVIHLIDDFKGFSTFMCDYQCLFYTPSVFIGQFETSERTNAFSKMGWLKKTPNLI